jgi:hypothetical protein
LLIDKDFVISYSSKEAWKLSMAAGGRRAMVTHATTYNGLLASFCGRRYTSRLEKAMQSGRGTAPLEW